MLLALMSLMAVAMFAQQDGRTCSRAIPMTKDAEQEFTYTVTSASTSSPKEVWFSAMTFDLPLSVYFAPDGGASAPAPDVEMDFSCLSGYYENEILCSLFCRTGGNSGLDIKMPYKATLESKTLTDGTFVYYISLGKRYRDLLLQMGISENLKVVVCVTFKSAGVLRLAPDDFFNNCMDGAAFMRIGDTVQVKAKDTERHVIVPYVQWQEDTILYTWNGAEPCRLVVGAKCDFDPSKDNTQDGLVQYVTIQPGETLKVKAEDIYGWVTNKEFPPQAGMYFAKFYSESEGEMKITKAEQSQPDGGATLMRFGTSYALDANSQALYAIPRSWNVDVMFSTPTAHLFSMQLSKTAAFDEADILATYTFKQGQSGRWIGITAKEMQAHWAKVAASVHYIYIRFICTEATSVTGDRWAVSECYTKTKDNTIAPGDVKTVTKNSTVVYRFSYPQWKGGDMTIAFALNSDCNVYLGDTCGMNTSTSHKDDAYWLRYASITKSSAPLVIPKEEIASWADRIDAEGCFYGMFVTSANSTNRKVTFTTNAPEETDPVYPAATITVACDGAKQAFVQVSQVQTIIVKNEAGETVKTISDAQPETKYSLADLPAGKYTIAGETEEIIVNL